MHNSNQWQDDSAELSRMKILVVDDEPVNIALLKEILAENSYSRVESVSDSSLVMDKCKTLRPDLILLDLMMPPPDGFAILESLQLDSEETFLPVVVLTADTNEETKRRALDAGATDFLLKPFDHVEVALRIRNLLKSRRAHSLLDNQRAALEDAVRERTEELRDTIRQLQKTNEVLSRSA
jgi:putative two-component system response regulator